MTFIHILFLSLIASIISGCVGSIENAAKDLTDANKIKNVSIEFAGITEAVAISHNKVSVGFKPATGGSEHFSYLVYLNGQYDLASASIDSSLVKLDSSGVAHVVVGNLSTGVTYSFAVRAYDPENNVSDSNTKVLTAQTMNTEVPNFDGIYKLSNVAGKSGETSLLVEWNKAISSLGVNGSFGGDVHDVSGYMIYYGESAIDMSTIVPINGADTLSYTLTGLKEGTDYFVRVHAVDSNNPAAEDGNIHYQVKKTLSNRPITFEGVKSLEIPTNRNGYHNMTVHWEAGTGSFDRYKIYIANSLNAFQGNRQSWNTANFEWIDTLTDTSVTSKSYYLSMPNTPYYVAVVACLSGDQNDCETFVGSTNVKSITTKPPVVPFAGIKDVGGLAPAAGLAGLTDINVFWDTPNTELGVYKRIEIFNCNDPSYLTPLTNVSVNGAYSLNASLRITGLETGKEYCFVAVAVEDIDSEPRFSATRTLRYVAPSFIPPTLQGLSSCTQKNSAGFKVNWPAAVGDMFTSYELFIKKKMTGDLFDWDKAIISTNQAASLNDFLSNSNKYYLNYLASSDRNYTFSNLDPGTTYQVGIRTFLTNGNKTYRSNPSILLECTTDALLAYHNGWLDVFSIGPKYDGVDKKFVAERLATNSETNSHVLYKHMFPVEDLSIIPTVTGSISGIIRINWYDFTLSNGKKIIENPQAGYKVYRKVHSALYDSGPPSISETLVDNGWKEVSVSGSLIKPTAAVLNDLNSVSYGQFIDYTAPHSVDSNEGTIYYYRIEAYVGDTHVDYAPLSSQASSADLIIRVVLPPKNMAFMHRWMANKQMCEEMLKTSDRNNNYRCSYNGLGSTLIDSKYYYDMKGDTFMDRFKLACPFSRGNTAYKCSEVSSGSFTNFEGKIGSIYDNTPNTKGIYNGDCLGYSGNPNGKIKSIPGAIFYDRTGSVGGCFINTSGALGSTTQGSVWKTLDSIDNLTGDPGDMLDYSYNSIYSLKTLNNTTSKSHRSINTTKIPPKNEIYSIDDSTGNKIYSALGEGWGTKIYSNDAGLPVLTAYPSSINWTCQSAKFTVNNKTYNKRLLRRKEQIAAYAPSPFLDRYSTISNKIIAGAFLTDALIATGSVQVDPDGGTASGAAINANSKDRDCYTNTYTYKFAGPAVNMLDLRPRSKDTNWISRQYSYQPLSGNNHVLALPSGSSGAVSTDACITRFGLQDYEGGSMIFISDTLFCDKTNKFCSFSVTNINQTTKFNPPWDSGYRENWRNEKKYATFSNSDSGDSNRMGIPFIYPENDSSKLFGDILGSQSGAFDLASTNTLNLNASGMRNFSLAMGVPLMCQGDSCTNTDDSTFALQSLGQPSLASIQLDSNIYNNRFYTSFISSTSPYNGFTLSYYANGQSKFTITPRVGWHGNNLGGGAWDVNGLGLYRRSGIWFQVGARATATSYCSQVVEDYSTP